LSFRGWFRGVFDSFGSFGVLGGKGVRLGEPASHHGNDENLTHNKHRPPVGPSSALGTNEGAETPAPVKLSQRTNCVPMRVSGQFRYDRTETEGVVAAGVPGSCRATAGATPVPNRRTAVRAATVQLRVDVE
jgi:hypothetical protein